MMKMNVGNFAKSAVLATGILAGACYLGSCNNSSKNSESTKSTEQYLQEDVIQAKKDVIDAQKQCKKDSVDFYAQAQDSTAAKKKIRITI